jgi:DNA ligase-1
VYLNCIVTTSERVRSTRSRGAKIREIAACLRSLSPEEIDAGTLYLAGEIRQGKVGIGYRQLYGDLPAAAESPRLSLHSVDDALSKLGRIEGKGAQGKRAAVLEELFGRATEGEQAFLRSLILQELRQGALEGVMLEAIAEAAGVPADRVRYAFMVSGKLDAVSRAALTGGLKALAEFRLTLFQPLKPMLAQPVTGPEEAIARLGNVVAEFKIDGARIQVHRSGGETRIFTRNLRNVTERVPDIVATVAAFEGNAFILDGEAVALRLDGTPHPFQVTMSRFGSRQNIETLRKELPLTPLFFDCLHSNGRDMIDSGGRERFEALRAICPPQLVIPRISASHPSDLRAFLDEALKRGHEGIMVKSTEARYEAGRRGSAWLKLKPVHTLDLVVLAAEWGSGRRRGWLSNLHLGARDRRKGTYVMLGKTFKGLTDKMLEWQTKRFLQIESSRERQTVYLRPEIVAEVAFDGLQKSGRYPGGLALRFARIKSYRPDKRPEEADTMETVRALHAAAGKSGEGR